MIQKLEKIVLYIVLAQLDLMVLVLHKMMMVVIKKIPQTGNVIIGDNVEIGSNSTIDRATLGSTIIHKGVKLDNQIQIAHNVEIGENTAISSIRYSWFYKNWKKLYDWRTSRNYWTS